MIRAGNIHHSSNLTSYRELVRGVTRRGWWRTVGTYTTRRHSYEFGKTFRAHGPITRGLGCYISGDAGSVFQLIVGGID